MQLVSFDTPAAFGAAAQSWLARKERENSITLSTLRRAILRGTPARGWLAADSGDPKLALFQIPPHFVQISEGDPDAAQFAAGMLETDFAGVVGLAAIADAFAKSWCARRGLRPMLHMEMTYYTLDRLVHVSLPMGRIRPATVEDVDCLLPMAAAAARDMNLPEAEQLPEEVERSLRQQIAEQRQFVWDAGSSIRALASYADGLEGRGARIRGIYTPPEFRRQGYGAAITASLTELLLEQGQAWVALFADNANPTSTAIYRRLGFTPQLVYRTWRFERALAG